MRGDQEKDPNALHAAPLYWLQDPAMSEEMNDRVEEIRAGYGTEDIVRQTPEDGNFIYMFDSNCQQCPVSSLHNSESY